MGKYWALCMFSAGGSGGGGALWVLAPSGGSFFELVFYLVFGLVFGASMSW